MLLFKKTIAAAQPFRVGVHFDNDEYLPAGNSDLQTDEPDTYTGGEMKKAPGVIIGTY